MACSSKLAALAYLLAATAALLPAARSLSSPLCEDGGATWVTAEPHADPRFPGASLFCACGRMGVCSRQAAASASKRWPAQRARPLCLPASSWSASQAPTVLLQLERPTALPFGRRLSGAQQAHQAQGQAQAQCSAGEQKALQSSAPPVAAQRMSVTQTMREEWGVRPWSGFQAAY